jgi:predicted Zn-dependent protease
VHWRSRAGWRTSRAGRAGGASARRRAALTACTTAIVLALTAGCATNPVTGKREFSLMSEAQEIQIGQEQDAQIRKEMGVYAERELQQYVSDIGLRLARLSERPTLPWKFTVVDAAAINAFALPGGFIYLTRGILPFLDNEAQLAGVVGHEIGHVTARHSAQQYSRATGAQLGLILGSILVPQTRPFAGLGQTGLGVLMLKYGRDDEVQADGLGVKYATAAGWDPAGIPQMLATLGRIEEASDNKGVPNWLSTHPAAEDRIQKVQSAVEAAKAGDRTAEGASSRFVTNRDAFLERLDGIIFGDNPEQGVVRGRSFLHAGLRFALEFPQGWDVNNGPTQVVAKDPQANAFLVMQLVQQPAGRTVQDVAVRSMQGAGFEIVDGARTTINGLDAFVGTYRGVLQDLGPVAARAAHVVHGDNVFLVAGLAPQQIFQREEPGFSRTIASFRPLTRAEAENIRPNRIDFYTARQGDTWQAIAERSGGIVKPSTLAIMNGHTVGDQPRPGERLKIVVAG